MVAPRKIRCKVITVVAEDLCMPTPTHDSKPQPRFRPSDLVPWADPYIAGLIHKLQAEVRSETPSLQPAVTERFGAPVADLEWPWDEGVADFEKYDTEPVETDIPRETERWTTENRWQR